jgi:glycosyltransferase involved in cell wall biosynthesis
VGRCRPDLADRLRRLAAERGVDLTLVGPLPHEAAMDEVAGATAGLSLLRALPNYTRSLPTKVIEYLQMGVPVVASDLPGTREAVGHLDGVALVPPADPAVAARALDRFVADHSVRTAAGAQIDGLRESLAWPAADVLRCYREAAGGAQ